MKEKPILYNGEMVRAVLEGRKTQTRRIIKPISQDKWLFDGSWSDKYVKNPGNFVVEHCPYGKVGDRLWVRETWKISSFMEGEPIEFQYRADMTTKEENEMSDCVAYEYWYENMVSDSSSYLEKIGHPMNNEGIYHWKNGESPLPWKPSIHMPRWASRITLEIINVKIERVQDISEADIIAEGCPNEYLLGKNWFIPAWNSIYSKRGFPWESNSWVWVIEFKVL